MNIYIDISIMAADESAGGRISGVLDLASVPTIGSTLVLSHAPNGVPYISVNGFTGHLKVTEVRFEPISNSLVSVALSLEDITAPTMTDARAIMQFLSDGFGLSAEDFELDK